MIIDPMETERLVESLRKFTLDEVGYVHVIKYANVFLVISFVIQGRELKVSGTAQKYGEA